MEWPHWTLKVFWRPIWLVGHVLLFLVGPFRIRGFWHVPKRGPLLILANHQSLLDPIAIQAACRRHIVFLANDDLFHMGNLSKFVRWWGAIPIKPNTPDRAALRRAAELLKAGHAVCIFPEGGLSKDAQLQPLLPGSILLARLAEPTVICVGLAGTVRVIPYESRKIRPAFRVFTAHWGKTKSASAMAEADLLPWAREELLRLMG